MSETQVQSNNQLAQEAQAVLAAAQANPNPDVRTFGQSSMHPGATAETVYVPGGGTLTADVDAQSDVIGVETHAAERRPNGGSFVHHTTINTIPGMPSEATVERNGRVKHFTGEQAERLGRAAVRRLAQQIQEIK